MDRRIFAVRWPFTVAILATLAGVTLWSLWVSHGGASAPKAQAVSAAANATATAAPQGGALALESPKTSPTPTLLEILQAADALAKAGKLPDVAPTPTLLEILQAADALAKAGKLPDAAPTPTLLEILQAADALAKAGKLPAAAPTPTLLEILQAADALAKAGKLPGQPPLAHVEQPAAPTPAPPAPAPAGDGWSDANYEARVLELINLQRAKFGLDALTVDERLERSAGDYAQVLGVNNWFSHTGPDGSTLVTRVEAAGFPFTVQIGEVIAWGNQGWTPELMVAAWMNSATHRQEILSPVYIRAGVGCYFTPDNGTTVHCVVDFAG